MFTYTVEFLFGFSYFCILYIYFFMNFVSKLSDLMTACRFLVLEFCI